MRLVAPQRLAPDDPLAGPADGLLDAEHGRAEAGCGLADAVLVHEALRQGEAAVELAEDRLVADAHIARG